MKQIIRIITACICACTLSATAEENAQNKTNSESPPDVGKEILEKSMAPPMAASAEYDKDETADVAIQWEQIEVDIPVGETTTAADFNFKGRNISNREINVQYVERTCGCQMVRINKTKFAPGETIEIYGRMGFAASSGKYERKLRIFLDKGRPSTLNVITRSPERIKISESAMVWKNTLEPKEITATPVGSAEITDVQILGRGFAHSVSKKDNTTTIKITPDGSNTKGAIRIKDSGSSRPSYITLDYSGKKP